MNITEFLVYLQKNDIHLNLDGESLKLNAPAGTLTPEMQAEIVERKEEIVTFLQMAEQGNRQLTRPKLTPIQPVNRQRQISLSVAQQRIWRQPKYGGNLGIAIHFEGMLRLSLLQSCLNHALNRHEMMRASFKYISGKVAMSISGTDELPLERQTIGESDWEQVATEAIGQPFDYNDLPLARAILLERSSVDTVLLLIAPAFLVDEASLEILGREILTLYQGVSNYVQGNPLPAISVQYADYIQWTQERLSGIFRQDLLAYWGEALSDLTPHLTLPFHADKEIVDVNHRQIIRFHLPVEINDQIKSICRQESATTYMFWLSLVHLMLFRYGQRSDIAVGALASNRVGAQLANMVGVFAAYLPIRANLDSNMSFRHLLRAIRQAMLKAFDHQEIIGVDLWDWNLNPPYHVKVAYFDQGEPLAQIPHLKMSYELLHDQNAASVALHIQLHEKADGIAGIFNYAANKMSQEDAARLAAHFEQSAAVVLERPDEPIGEMPLLTKTEQELLNKWNETEYSFPDDLTVPGLFERQAHQNPLATALIIDQDFSSYEQLNDQATQLAYFLRSTGLETGQSVGLAIERSSNLIAGWLGTLKAGGIVVPLDPELPAERLAEILADSDAYILLTEQHLQERLSLPPAQFKPSEIICLDEDWVYVARAEEVELPPVEPTTAMCRHYLAHGEGAFITHQQIINLSTWMARQIESADAPLIGIAPDLNQINTLSDIWSPLLTGGALAMVPPHTKINLKLFVNHIAENGANQITVDAKLLTFLLDEYPDLGEAVPQARIWYCQREGLTPPLAHRFQQAAPQARLISLSSWLACGGATLYYDPAEWSIDAGIPLGRPIANAKASIVDYNSQPMPFGVEGDLQISGVSAGASEYFMPNIKAIRLQNGLIDSPAANNNHDDELEGASIPRNDNDTEEPVAQSSNGAASTDDPPISDPHLQLPASP